MDNMGKLLKKIADINKEVISIDFEKSGQNYTGEMYHKLDDFIIPIQNICYKHNCYFDFNFPFNHQQECYTAELHFIDLDNDDVVEKVFNAPFPLVLKASNGQSIMQSISSYVTYSKKILLGNVFNISENTLDLNEDPDDGLGFKKEKVVDHKNKNIKTKPAKLDIVLNEYKNEYHDEEFNKGHVRKIAMNMMKNKKITKEEYESIYHFYYS